MNSMTGYGRAVAAVGRHTLTVQITAVNRKGLDLSVSLPEDWAEMESEVIERVRKVALRGKVHVALVVSGGGRTGESPVDRTAVDRALGELEKLAAGRGFKFEPTPELLWEILREQKKAAEEAPPIGGAKTAAMNAIEEALRSFAAMRAREGEALLIDFLRRIEKLRGHLEAIASRAPHVPGAYREQLFLRLRQAGLELDLNDERVLKEVALFADRCDVSEEITRLRSHVEQLMHHLRGGGEVGRKAEFILQEIGREIHTIGSKANDLTMARVVIEFKNELERVREQIANVE
ncbi:MAG: YicC family protein [Opitutaceae bacterium]|nr:YicC family protein [Opitutaceae bacterium]